MQYKTVSFFENKFKFNRGINAISFDDYRTFDILAFPLMAISQLYDENFLPFFDEEIDCDGPSNMDVNFSFSDGNNENISFNFIRKNIVGPRWIKEHSKFCDSIIEKEKSKPILAYYRKGNCACQEIYQSKYNNLDLKNPYNEFEWYPWKDYCKEYNFFSQLAIDAKYGKKDEFSICHYTQLKKIADEILSVTCSENFDFALDLGKFVYYNDSRCCNAATDMFDFGITIGMIMQLYIACLSKKEDNFLGYPCDSSGIVICNYNFGERPSYSDKKWDYYRIFEKYFPKIQFIVC